jgi:D-2-hydroxyacid dehydrogenase (NADP+)
MNILVMMDEHVRLEPIAAVAPGRVTVNQEPPGAFENDAGMFPPTIGDKPRRPWHSDRSPEEREALLRETHILVCGLPYPLSLRSRMPNLQWTHFTWAGVSDFRHSDLWGSGAVITSGRGMVQALPIAEMVIAATLSFAKDLGLAQRQTEAGRLDPSPYSLKLVAGKTMGVLGLGGIGGEIARLAKALGMRVVATRRSTTARTANSEGVDLLYPAAELHAMLAESDFVAVTPPLTPETDSFLDTAAFASMKPGAYLLNVARGEVIDDAALKHALRSGALGGAYLDVYRGELTDTPDAELMAFPNVVMTPHNSGDTDLPQWDTTQQVVNNLSRFLAGEPLQSEVDYTRGY